MSDSYMGINAILRVDHTSSLPLRKHCSRQNSLTVKINAKFQALFLNLTILGFRLSTTPFRRSVICRRNAVRVWNSLLRRHRRSVLPSMSEPDDKSLCRILTSMIITMVITHLETTVRSVRGIALSHRHRCF